MTLLALTPFRIHCLELISNVCLPSMLVVAPFSALLLTCAKTIMVVVVQVDVNTLAQASASVCAHLDSQDLVAIVLSSTIVQ